MPASPERPRGPAVRQRCQGGETSRRHDLSFSSPLAARRSPLAALIVGVTESQKGRRTGGTRVSEVKGCD